MKKILTIIVITISITSLSCKKCATCTQTTTTTVTPATTGYPQTSTTTFEACGQDLKDINGKTVTSTSKQGNITATATSKTVCK